VERASRSTSWVTHLLITLVAIVLGSRFGWPRQLWAQGGPMILSLGDDSYIAWSELVSRTGAVLRRELGGLSLMDFSVLVLSNISYTSLPDPVRDGLQEFLARGGSVLFTGGDRSYGSGGYVGTQLADLLPLRPLTRDDFGYQPYGSTLLLVPGHPILRDVEIPSMGYFNTLLLTSGSVEIAQYTRSRRLAWPLVAERHAGAGTILAIALDMALPLDKGIWKDRGRFARNCVEHLLQQSRINAPQRPTSRVHGVTPCCAT
jgi:hypothetical protein